MTRSVFVCDDCMRVCVCLFCSACVLCMRIGEECMFECVLPCALVCTCSCVSTFSDQLFHHLLSPSLCADGAQVCDQRPPADVIDSSHLRRCSSTRCYQDMTPRCMSFAFTFISSNIFFRVFYVCPYMKFVLREK